MANSVTLTARVDDRDGNPIEGVTVVFIQNGSYAATGETDSNGETASVSVQPGYYRLRAIASGYLTTSSTIRTLSANSTYTMSVTMKEHSYKSRGEQSGAEMSGVVGVATASSGLSIGVRGEAPHPDGYGLYTSDDAYVGGTLGVGSVEVQDKLPTYYYVSDLSSDSTLRALKMLFDETAWMDGTYRDGPSHGENTNAFFGSVLTQRGEVVFVPLGSANVGVYDPTTDTYPSGASHGETGPYPFIGGTISQTGDVVFAPYDADNIGQYDPNTDTYTAVTTHGEGDDAFAGATVEPWNRHVVFAPSNADHVGIYDARLGTYTQGPAHGEGDDAFRGAVLTHYGQIVFVPHGSDHVGIYDPSLDSYIQGPAHGQGDDAFAGGALTPEGTVVFAPHNADNVGIFDPGINDYSFTAGPTHGEGDEAFHGASLSPTGNVVFAPLQADYVGVYDPDYDSYSSDRFHGQGANAFGGVTLVPSGELVFAPYNAGTIGVYDSNAQTQKPRVTAVNPLVNNT